MDQLDVGIGSLVEEQRHDVECRRLVENRQIRPRRQPPERVHIDRVIERRAAIEVPFVDIRARLDQHLGEIEMPVLKRDVQGRHTLGVCEIEIGAAVDQRLDARNASLPRGIDQRREAAVIHVLLARLRGYPALPVPVGPVRILVGAVFDQQLDHLRLALRRRPHQCRLPAPAFLGVHIRAVLEQGLGGVQSARPRHHHQRHLTLVIRGIRLHARLEQHLDDGR